MTLAQLLPDQYGLELQVQVVALLTRATHHSEKTEDTIAVAEYLVCDTTSQAILKVEDDQINVLRQNKSVHLINARTTAFNGQLRIVVDQHPKFGGKIEPNFDAPTIDDPFNLPNISDTQFTRIDRTNL